MTEGAPLTLPLWYRVALWCALPLVWLRLKWRALKESEYGARQAERFGNVPDDVRGRPVWIHTVSAGETIAASPLVKALVDEFPDAPFLVTTMTPTGSAQVLERLQGSVDHCYAPYDFGFAVERFYRRVQPRMLILMETELWPNLIRNAVNNDVPVLLVNARLSERSAAGYGRIPKLTRFMLRNLDLIACQEAQHVERFVALGAPSDRVHRTGSVKFDAELPPGFNEERVELQDRWALTDRPVWIAASTHPGEDELVLEAFLEVRRAVADAVLLLVPRHPVRTDDVVQLVSQAGLAVHRHSADAGTVEDVLVADVMGKLQVLYGLADVAFVGGSLVELGGHNPVEPALCGVPMLCGPHQFNFADAMTQFQAAGALLTIDSATELGRRVVYWFEHPDERRAAGQAGLAVVARNRGAQAQLLELLSERIRACVTADP